MLVALVLIGVLWVSIPSEMAPMEDRGQLSVNSTAPEGATFDYTLRYSDELSQFMLEDAPEITSLFQIVGLWNTNSALDRKSTRLNSSHVRISYAVFCLKK